ncbi:MAG: terminase family protein, partial [Acidobacteriota bacterium]|nr:terminase family protein [Acidobacteriota bacterium]
GGGKSDTCLLEAIWRSVDDPRGSSIIFRRTYPELEQLIERSRYLYSQCGATFTGNPPTWRFPSGMRVKFRHVEHDKAIWKYHGAEYDFIAFDESTFFTEAPVRLMFGRLRSSSPSLHEQRRMRLYTNPGNEGHSWHKDVFMGNGCSHCKYGILEDVIAPWHEYRDRKWPSDSRAIGCSTRFIPATLDDHNIWGENNQSYREQLNTMQATYAKAMATGCWDIFVGQFYDCWDESKMVVKRQLVGEKFWWPTWVGIDYGFSGSSAYAVLCTKDPNGVTYAIDEILESHMKASDFAVAIRDRWAKGATLPGPYYLSPDAWNDRTDAHTIADQMLEASGLGFEKASNDRVGGAMLLYTMLHEGKLKIADTCTQIIKCIPGRVHDTDKNPNDVLKVKESPLDDVYDGLRYSVYSYLRPARKPNSVLLEEAVAHITDPTQAMIHRKKVEHELNKQTDVVSYRGSQPWRFGR